MSDFEFTSDWFSTQHPNWPKFPEPIPSLAALELGSHEGRSAVWMIENILTHPESSLTCIDHWQNAKVEERFDRNIRATGQVAKVRKIKADHWSTLSALSQLPLGFDLIYVDGDHEGRSVFEDAVWAFRLLVPGGYLIFDDYEWEQSSVHILPKPAIDGFLAVYAPWIEVVHKGWQVIVRKHF